MADLIAALEATVHRVLEKLGRELADLELSHGEVNALAQLDEDATVAELQRATGQRASTLDRRPRPARAPRPRGAAAQPARQAVVQGLPHRGRPSGPARVAEAFRALEEAALAGVSARSAKGFFEVLAALDREAER